MRITRIRPLLQLAIAWSTMFLIGTELFVMSPLIPFLAADFRISTAVAGVSVTVFSATYMVSAPVFGNVGDGGCWSAASLSLPQQIFLPRRPQVWHHCSRRGS